MSDVLTIVEYDSISCECGEHPLSKHDFDALVDFIKCNHDEKQQDLLKIGTRAGIKGVAVTASNYVGTIQFKSGKTVEILPKIGDHISLKRSREIFLEMLGEVRELNFKTSNLSEIDISKLTILEIFISEYIRRIREIVRIGLASAYHDVRKNERFLKGPIIFSEDTRRNIVHKERFFIEYQLYDHDRPENRLIKSTLVMLHNISSDDRNRRNIRSLLSYFDDVPLSNNVDLDLDGINLERNMHYYIDAIEWTKIFLSRKSFNVFAGQDVSFALLFPMDKLYEKYIAGILSKDSRGLEFITHESSFLFKNQNNEGRVEIIPDIVVKKDGNYIAVLDTKWKMISNENSISQSDLYQMFVYSSKYECNNAILIYPRISNVTIRYVDARTGIMIRNFNYDYDEPNLDVLFSMIVDGWPS